MEKPTKWELLADFFIVGAVLFVSGFAITDVNHHPDHARLWGAALVYLAAAVMIATLVVAAVILPMEDPHERSQGSISNKGEDFLCSGSNIGGNGRHRSRVGA